MQAGESSGEGKGPSSAEQEKLQKELSDMKEEAAKSKQEADRLLQQVKMEQEEKKLQENLIKELQEWVFTLETNS